MEQKTCHCCQQPLRGRSDKKFCNDYCRNSHHNQRNSDVNRYMRSVNYCLRKNRRILQAMLSVTKPIVRISKQQLECKGFSFSYITHQYSNRKGKPVFYCYEFGYRLLEKEQVLILQGKNER